jgi:hypothetical protein
VTGNSLARSLANERKSKTSVADLGCCHLDAKSERSSRHQLKHNAVVAFKNERVEAPNDRYGFALVGVGKQLHVHGFMLSDLLILAVHYFDCDCTPWVRLLILCWSG